MPPPRPSDGVVVLEMQKGSRIGKRGMVPQRPNKRTLRARHIPRGTDGILNKRMTQVLQWKRQRRGVQCSLINLVTTDGIHDVPSLVLPLPMLSVSLQPSCLVKVERLYFRTGQSGESN